MSNYEVPFIIPPMLKLLRKKGVAKKVLWVVAIIIILSFGFFGSAYLIRDMRHTQYAGKIFGKKVSTDDFGKAFETTRVQAIIRYGDNYNKVLPFINLDRETWDRIMLLHEVNKKKIQVSDQEVVEAVQAFPFFQKDKKFNNSLYTDMLRYVFRLEAREFEEMMREQLRLTKLFDEITGNITLTEDEILERFKKENEKIVVSYILVKPESFKDQVGYDEEKVKAYFEKNKLDFMVPPSINAQYIQLNFPKDADDQIKASLKKQADEITQLVLSKGATLQEAAAKNNLEVKTTGFISQEAPKPELGWSFEMLQKILQLEVNQIDGPFETPNGLAIVQLTEKRDATIPSYEEVKDKVKEAYILSEAKEIAQKKADENLTAIRNEMVKDPQKDFAATTQALDLPVSKTPLFSRGQYLPEIGISSNFDEAAFGLSKEDKVSAVVSTDAGYCILHLDEVVPINKEEFEKKREEIVKALTNERKNTLFNDYLTKLRLEAHIEDNISKMREQAQNN